METKWKHETDIRAEIMVIYNAAFVKNTKSIMEKIEADRWDECRILQDQQGVLLDFMGEIIERVFDSHDRTTYARKTGGVMS